MMVERDPARTETAQALLQVTRDVIARVIAPRAAEIDAEAHFPRDVYSALADAGLCAIWVPQEYGGIDVDLRTKLEIVDLIAQVSASSALVYANTGDAAAPFVLAASEEIKATYLPGIASGQIIPAFGLTEPGAGSDAAAVTTRAVEDGDHFVIDGSKVFITNGSVGGVFTIFARTEPADASHRGLSAFVVSPDAAGFTIDRDEDLVGLRGCPNSAITLSGVRVPRSSMIGGRGEGFRVAMLSLDEARLHAAAMSLGIASGALDVAVRYARERIQFGQPIIEHQGIQFLLADMATSITAGRALLSLAADSVGHGDNRRASLHAAMIKLFATDVGMKVAIDAVQVLGGYGLSRDYPVERMMRDAKAYQIFDGTNQIQRMIIGRHLAKADLDH
jgi:alkylation response protein AidB-like acyl-CoA dehydrogenase